MSSRHKARRLKGQEVEDRAPEKWDSPGCCDQAGYSIMYDGKKWAVALERQGACEPPVANFCPGCGTKLTAETPVRKRWH